MGSAERLGTPQEGPCLETLEVLGAEPSTWCRRRGLLPASGAERSEAGLGTTKEVLFIIDFLDFNKEFLGFPIALLGFHRIYIRISTRIS